MSNPRKFDRVAWIYQAGEYLSFGPTLERCRFFFLPELTESRRALILGDGDGRFAVRLLAASPGLHADAVDGSPAMLRRLSARVARRRAQHRLATACADIRGFTPSVADYDLVATHFFLDCLTAAETASLVERVLPHLAPDARWVVSEFQIPSGTPLRAHVYRLLITALYAGFRLLTGLAVRELPPWRDALARAGFVCISTRTWLGGLLVSELWQFNEATASADMRSHLAVPADTELVTPGQIPGIDPGPEPTPGIPPEPKPQPAPGPPPEPDPQPYPGPIPAPQPVT
ncbi:MAG: class I SAM-dependent methyltransferase [Acidobacteriaceae bacterium]